MILRAHYVPTPNLFRLMVFVGFLISFFLFSQTDAYAADLRATAALPTNGATFYDSENITFLGAAENIGGDYIGQGGYGDVEIDWNSDGGPEGPGGINGHDAHYNAYNDGTLNDFSPGFVKSLEKTINSPVQAGTHRYRFNADTNNVLAETNESNNRSAWVTFVVEETPFAPTISFTATENPITLGESTDLNWSVTYGTACSKSSDPAGWNGSGLAGPETMSPSETTTYTLDCTGSGGSAQKSLTVNVSVPAPTITFTASNNTIVSGGSTNLTWSTSHADSCAKSSSPAGWSSGSEADNTVTVSPTQTTTYTLNCTGSGGSASKSVIINVTPPAPGITFFASASSVPPGGTTNLQWIVTNATACSVPTTVTGWSGSKNAVSGNTTVTVPTTRSFSLACGNASGSTTKSVTITISGVPNLSPQQWSGSNRIEHTAPVQEGSLVAFRGKVENIGTAATPIGFMDRFVGQWGWVSDNINLGYVSNGALGVGLAHEPYDESTTAAPTRSGLLQIEYCVDQASTPPTSRITESNESNCTYRSYSVPGLPGAPMLAMSISPNKISSTTAYSVNRPEVGAISTITWTTTGATSCEGSEDSASAHDDSWAGAKPTNGSFQISPYATSSYALKCVGPGGTVIKAVRANVNFKSPQILSFTASDNSILRGSSVDLSWTATSSYECTASGGWSGTKDRQGGTETVGSINTQTTFTLTCKNSISASGGTVIRNLTVDVYDPPPQITFSANQNPITPIDEPELTWSTTDATSCTASNGWSGSKTTGSNQSETVSPDVTTTYTLSCTGPGGVENKSVTITVAETAPIISPFSVAENLIVATEDTTIEWDVAGATSCTATEGTGNWLAMSSGTLVSGGQLSISPLTTTQFEMECTGPWGTTVSPSITVQVVPKADINVFQICAPDGSDCTSYDPNIPVRITLNPNTERRIEWDVDDATSCYATGGGQFATGGAVNGNDDVFVSPLPGEEFTYTLACSYSGKQTNTASFIVEINPVVPNIWLSEKVVRSDGKITVYWDTNNGDQSVCSLSGSGLNDTDLDAAAAGGSEDEGSKEVTITGQTTFTLTCGTESDIEIVELSPAVWES